MDTQVFGNPHKTLRMGRVRKIGSRFLLPPFKSSANASQINIAPHRSCYRLLRCFFSLSFLCVCVHTCAHQGTASEVSSHLPPCWGSLSLSHFPLSCAMQVPWPSTFWVIFLFLLPNALPACWHYRRVLLHLDCCRVPVSTLLFILGVLGLQVHAVLFVTSDFLCGSQGSNMHYQVCLKHRV